MAFWSSFFFFSNFHLLDFTFLFYFFCGRRFPLDLTPLHSKLRRETFRSAVNSRGWANWIVAGGRRSIDGCNGRIIDWKCELGSGGAKGQRAPDYISRQLRGRLQQHFQPQVCHQRRHEKRLEYATFHFQQHQFLRVIATCCTRARQHAFAITNRRTAKIRSRYCFPAAMTRPVYFVLLSWRPFLFVFMFSFFWWNIVLINSEKESWKIHCTAPLDDWQFGWWIDWNRC